MALNMRGHIDRVFQSTPARRFPVTDEGYDDDGVPTARTIGTATPHVVTIQPVSERERQSLAMGGERVQDVRRVYVNDGDLYSLAPADLWRFDALEGEYKVVRDDVRPWRNYAKLIVARRDDREETPA